MVIINFGLHFGHGTMYYHRWKIPLLVALILALAGAYAPVYSQNIKDLNENGGNAAQKSTPVSETPSQFLIEPEAQIKGDRIKKQTYRTQQVGQNKNWDLDMGRFQGKLDEDPNNPHSNRTIEDVNRDTFTGMRLRLPFRGRTGN
jgi:hypothetical protein